MSVSGYSPREGPGKSAGWGTAHGILRGDGWGGKLACFPEGEPVITTRAVKAGGRRKNTRLRFRLVSRAMGLASGAA